MSHLGLICTLAHDQCSALSQQQLIDIIAHIRTRLLCLSCSHYIFRLSRQHSQVTRLQSSDKSTHGQGTEADDLVGSSTGVLHWHGRSSSGVVASGHSWHGGLSGDRASGGGSGGAGSSGVIITASSTTLVSGDTACEGIGSSLRSLATGILETLWELADDSVGEGSASLLLSAEGSEDGFGETVGGEDWLLLNQGADGGLNSGVEVADWADEGEGSVAVNCLGAIDSGLQE